MKIVALALALTLSAFGSAPAWLTSLWSESAIDEGCGMDPLGCPDGPQPSSDKGAVPVGTP